MLSIDQIILFCYRLKTGIGVQTFFLKKINLVFLMTTFTKLFIAVSSDTSASVDMLKSLRSSISNGKIFNHLSKSLRVDRPLDLN